MKGKWAQGLRPRAFTWVIKDRIAASERPGGYARNHRKVRRDEELIWLRQQGFTHVLSLLDSPHNLTAYEEFGLPFAHVPLGRPGHEGENLARLYDLLKQWYASPDELVLVHHEEFGDRLCGVIGGFLLAAELIRGEAMAVAVTERLTGRQLGPAGRAIVQATIMNGLAPDTPPPPEPEPEPEPAPARRPARSRARRPAAKKPAARKKPAAKKPARKPAAKKPARKKPAAAKKPAPKKPIRKPAARKPASKKPLRKPAARKPAAAKKPAAKKPVKR